MELDMREDGGLELRRGGALLLIGAALFVPAALVIGPQDVLLDALSDLALDFEWTQIAGVVALTGVALQWVGAGFLADAVAERSSRLAAGGGAVLVGMAALVFGIDAVGTFIFEADWAADLAQTAGVSVTLLYTIVAGTGLSLVGLAMYQSELLPREAAVAGMVLGLGSVVHAVFVDRGALVVPSVGLALLGVVALGVATRIELAASAG